MYEESYKNISKGEIFTLSTGEYSDYYVIAVGKALEDFNLDDAKEQFLSETGTSEENNSSISFSAWLLSKGGLATELDYKEIHVGSYGRIDPSIEVNHK